MRTSFSKLSLLALPLAALTACQDYEPFSEAEVAQTMYNRDYTEAFENAFGKIDPEQNWGFNPMPIGGVDYGETRGSNTNSNEWESVFHYEVPGPRGGETTETGHPWGWAAGDVTNYERAYVYWWFSTHQWPKTMTVNWNNFFIENVWGQPEHSRTKAENSGTFSGETLGMDQLLILKAGGTKNSPSPSDAGSLIKSNDLAKTYKFADEYPNYEHANDFNAGGGAKEQVMYLYDVSTLDFAYLASEQDEEKYHNNWTIQRINGNYYLAFDYWHAKTSETSHCVEADGYYNDWILKLSNGEHKEDYYTRRIMCEDLGNTFDWDWNDVVFDVTTYMLNGSYYAMITLQAAGGTMPIYVGDKQHEAHAMFGVPTDTPVNVEAPGNVKRPAVVYSIQLTSDQLIDQNGKKYCLAEKIPVYVGSAQDPTRLVTLDAELGKAPQKFACASNTYWMKERTHIDRGHKFTKWVEKRTDTNQFEWVQMENTYMRHCSDASPLTDAEKSVLYADLGKPTAVSYYPTGDGMNSGASDTFVEWRTLWNSMVQAGGLEREDFTSPRIWEKKDGTVDKGRSFISQAPNIYETQGQDDDPIAFSTNVWDKVKDLRVDDEKGQMGPFEQVWPQVLYYTLTLNVDNNTGGTVTGAGRYASGSQVTIEAIPADGYIFQGWNDYNNFATRQVTIESNAEYTAYFKAVTTVFDSNNDTWPDNDDLTSLITGKNRYIVQVTFKDWNNQQQKVTIKYSDHNNWDIARYNPESPVNQQADITKNSDSFYLKVVSGKEFIDRMVVKVLAD